MITVVPCTSTERTLFRSTTTVPVRYRTCTYHVIQLESTCNKVIVRFFTEVLIAYRVLVLVPY
jgi:hypothetical protein